MHPLAEHVHLTKKETVTDNCPNIGNYFKNSYKVVFFMTLGHEITYSYAA